MPLVNVESRQDGETVGDTAIQDASKINRVSSISALVNSLVQQINERFPGSTTSASRMLAGGRELDSMPTLEFNWQPLPPALIEAN